MALRDVEAHVARGEDFATETTLSRRPTPGGLANDPGERFSMVLTNTNPPLGKKSNVRVVNEQGELEAESHAYVLRRPDTS